MSEIQEKWKDSNEYKKCVQLAKQGDPEAMFSVGSMCEKNRADSEAWSWYLRAAKKGNALAYYKLGRFLEDDIINEIINIDDKIIKFYGISAVLGCSWGQKKLADCYYSGSHGLDKNVDLAVEWYKYSANQNNPEAALYLGKTERDPAKALSWFKRAADSGNAEAQYFYGINCKSPEEKEKWISLSVKNGYLPAIFELAEAYEKEGSAEANRSAYKLYVSAMSEHHSAEAAVRMAEMLISGVDGIDRDIKHAKEFIDFAAQYNHPEALYKLGCMYWAGNEALNIERDKNKAFELMKKAADKKHIGASFNTGAIYSGKGDYKNAKRFLAVAAEGGHNSAILELAKVCWAMESYNESISWYKKSAETGNGEAQIKLGTIYREGNNVGKNYLESIRYYSMQPTCEDSNIQLLVGQMYQSGGHGISKDLAKAYTWNKKAAEQGETEAAYLVGNALRFGVGVSEDKEAAFEWLEKAAHNNNIAAISEIGEMCASGEGIQNGEPDIEKALFYDNLGIQLGSAKSSENLAFIYYQGLGSVEKDLETAFTLFLEAAEKNLVGSQAMVAKMYSDGTGISKNVEESLAWYKRAADNNDGDSALIVAEIYDSGEIVQKDDEQALKYYEISANQGNAKACDAVGYMYMMGIGCKHNLSKARRYFELAAKSGIARSQCFLGGLLYTYDKDYDQAFRWYKESAEQNYAPAQYQIANMYSNGEGASNNDEEALWWYEKAASQKYLKAIERAGYMYETERGVRHDSSNIFKAIKYYEQAIERDSFFAKERMGILLLNGNGVEADYNKAFEYLYDAASNGNRVEAQRQIAFMYRDGIGVTADLALAYRWFEEASRSLDPESLFEAAEMLRIGSGTETNLAAAYNHYVEAAKKGHTGACDWAGYMSINGIACTKDVSAARKYLSVAADDGIPRAQYTLGGIYFAYDNNYPKALDLFTSAAQSNYVYALNILGELYANGEVVEKNLKLAENYLRRAIQQGSLKSMALLGNIIWNENSFGDYSEAVNLFRYVIENDRNGQAFNRATILNYLGDAYKSGKGVEQDYTNAFYYYEQGVNMGDSDAMVSLSRMYSEGKGVSKDKKMAFNLMEKAAELGNEYAIRKTNSFLYRTFGIEL